MPLDSATLEAQLTAIQAAITAKLAGGHIDDWQVGHVRFDNSSSLETLFKMQESVTKQLRSIPCQSIDTHQNAVDAFGHDGNEYYNEEP